MASVEREAYVELARTHAALSAGFARLLKPHGLSEAQFDVLRIVSDAGSGASSGGAGGGGGRTMEGISAAMAARDPDVTRLVDRLERTGLVERQRSEEDRRVVMVRITPKGRGLLRKLAGPVEALHASQFGPLGDRRLVELVELLRAARGGRGEGGAAP